MNDVTELEPSVAGAIDFFQHLHHKIGALQKDTSAQHDQLHSLSTTLVTLERDRQSDRQTLATLANDLSGQDARLTRLQTDSQALDKQLSTVETLVACFQEQQQEVRQTLATLANDLQTQDADLRQQLTSALTHQAAPVERVSALEARLASQTREQLGLLGSFQALDQGARTLQSRMAKLEARIEQHQEQFGQLGKADHGQQQQLEAFAAIVEAQHKRLLQLEIALDELNGFSTATQQDIESLKNRLENQHRGSADAAQTQQTVQKQQERVKRLETLVDKVAVDTNSTRQILNVLQTDLTTQSDTLRELDQSWRNSLALHHDRLSQLEITTADFTSSRHQDKNLAELRDHFATQLNTLQQQMGAFESTLAHLRQTPEADTGVDATALDHLRQDLSAQAEELDETQQLAWSQIQDLQQRLSDAEATLDSLHQTSGTEAGADTEAALNSLRQDLVAQAESVDDIQELAWSQIQDLQQRLSDTEATLDNLHSAPVAEPTTSVDGDALHRLRETVTAQTAALDQLQQAVQPQIQNLQQRLSDAEVALDHVRQTPEAEPGSGLDLEAVLDPIRQALATQAEMLDETQELAWSQIQDLQQRLSEAEATLDQLDQTPETQTDSAFEAGLDSLRQDLSAQAGALHDLREATQQQFADLSATLETRQQESQEIIGQLSHLQQEIQHASIDSQRLETAEHHTWELQQELGNLQETVTALETRLSSQSQAFSGNFEQFRNLNIEIHALQQQVAQLETPQQLGDIDQELATYQQDIAQLRETVEQLQTDSQQMGEMIQQGDADSPIATIIARLDEQQERLNELVATVETVRVDAKSSQETVVNMATNVAKRIHEIQNLLIATETTQGERLQEVEQKLIWLQAALETMESQKTKSRRWFNMPASLTSILLTISAAGLAIYPG